MNEINWEQIEERTKRKEQQIQRLHYSKERQVIKVSIFNQANEWARLQMKKSKRLFFDNDADELIKKWLTRLCYDWKEWDMEFDNFYFKNIQEKKEKSELKIKNEK
jgi:hypothetical protein